MPHGEALKNYGTIHCVKEHRGWINYNGLPLLKSNIATICVLILDLNKPVIIVGYPRRIHHVSTSFIRRGIVDCLDVVLMNN